MPKGPKGKMNRGRKLRLLKKNHKYAKAKTAREYEEGKGKSKALGEKEILKPK